MSENTESPAEDADEDTGSKSSRLTAAQWEEIRTLWELGEIRLSKIVEKYGISKQAVMKYFKRNNVTHGSRKGEIKTAIVAGVAKATVAAAVPGFADKRKQRIEDTREAHYVAADMLSKLANKTIMDCVRATPARSLSSVKEDLRALRYAAAIQEQALNMRLEALSAHDEIDEKEMPEFQVSDLTDQDIEELRAKNGDDEDMGDDLLLETYEVPEDEDDDD